MKILRTDLQTGDETIFDSKEQLRKSLIDLHIDHILSDEQTDETYIEKYKKWSLNKICNMFDWGYKTITNKQAELNNV